MADEYIRKQDVVDIIEKEMKHYVSDVWYKSATHSALNNVNEDIKSLEPADVVPVVRCKNCKHFYFADNRIPQEQRYVCEISGEIWKPDSFCSYGERREE